jgi:Carboxypeptidase regulatory-like domain/TonB-dependent Receptor Plug Domain
MNPAKIERVSLRNRRQRQTHCGSGLGHGIANNRGRKMTLTRKLFRLCVFCLALANAVICFAQTETARLQGTITDPSDAAVAKASVTITNTGTGLATTEETNGEGYYVVPGLPPGHYHMEVSQTGFQKFARDFDLQVSQIAVVDVKLLVGSSTQSVVVAAGSPVIDAADSSIATVIEGRQITELPLNGRNFTQLATLVPGVNRGIATGAATGTQNNTETFRYSESGGASLSVNGLPPQANNFIFDGIDNNETLVNTIIFFTPADALQEFTVITNIAPAEYGRAGGGIVSSTLHSGSNEFHGSAFWFHRDENLDSKFFFDSGNKPVFARNQFGGTVGGPVIKNKLFFFVDYQGLRLNQPQGSSVGTVPTDLMRTGDFSELLCGSEAATTCPASTGLIIPVHITDPITGLQFEGSGAQPNVIPAGRINSVGDAYLKAFPEPNCPLSDSRCGTIINNYVNSSNLVEDWNDFDVRADYNLSAKDQVFARYSWGKDDNIEAPFLTTLPSGFGTGTTFNHPNGASIGWTHSFQANVINEMHFGYVRTTYGYTPPFANVPICNNLGIPNCNNSSDLGGIALIGGSNSQIEYTGDYGPYLVPQTSFDWNNSLSWVKGNHTIKMGASIIRRQLNLFRPITGKGFFNLFGNGGGQSATGYEVSDLLAGFVSTYQDGVPFGTIGTRSWEDGFFAEDDWRVNQRLTLNLGMRWDVFTQPIEVDNRQANFDIASGALIIAGSNGAPRGLVPNDWNNFGPRAGFAYQLTSDGKTVVRGGIGVFYFVDRGGISNQLGQNPPFSGSASFQYSNGYRIALSGSLPCSPSCTQAQLDSTTATAPVPTGASAFANLDLSAPTNVSVISYLTTNVTPQVTEWNLQVQHQLGTNTSVSVAYVGDHGAHLPGYYDSNEFQFDMAEDAPGSRLYEHLGSISTYNTYGKSNYHSLQAEFERRFTAGLQVTSSFTWEKETDNSCGAYDCQGPQNFRDLSLEQGLSNLDVPYRFVLSSLYELPFGHGHRWGSTWSRPMEIALGGWQFNGIYTLQSGLPFDLIVGGGAQPDERPDRVGAPGVNPGNLKTYINSAAFAAPPATLYPDGSVVFDRPGTAGRNIMLGPGLSNLDFALFKNFHVSERVNVSFRLQYYNITNTPHFGQPNSTFGSYNNAGVFNPNAQFGQILSVLPDSNREGELGLRITF